MIRNTMSFLQPKKQKNSLKQEMTLDRPNHLCMVVATSCRSKVLYIEQSTVSPLYKNAILYPSLYVRYLCLHDFL